MIGLPAALWPRVAGVAGVPWPPPDAAAAPAFIATAQREDLLPLLLDEPVLPPALAALAARHRATAALQRRAGDLRSAAMQELVKAAGDDALLFYKGADYAWRLYERPGLRPMGDIDVLAAPGRADAVLARLAQAGYPRVHDSFGAPFRPGYDEISIEVGGVHVEVHRSFAQPVRSAIDYAALWARRERFDVAGVPAWRLAPADVLLAHAYNLALDEFSSRLIRFVDLHLLLQRHAALLPQVAAQARAWHVQRALFGALHVFAQLFPEADSPLLRETRESLLDARTRIALARLLPDRRVVGSEPPPRGLQLRRKLALFDQPWRPAVFALRHAAEVPLGWWHEWRARRRGAALPSRASLR